ncbi:hypothetical protein TrRE_jg2671, partial [Triparma retinervis]
LRDAAMKLHTVDQAPREGKAPAQRPVSNWAPGRVEYLSFLRDSLEVYTAFEEIIDKTEGLEGLRDTGLERSEALRKDMKFFEDKYKLKMPKVGQPGRAYATYLRTLADKQADKQADGQQNEGQQDPNSNNAVNNANDNANDNNDWLPRFVCHYYNHYFAHTAGGRMIGKKMGDLLLDSHTLNFYQWSGDVRSHMEGVKNEIDGMAEGWGEEGREICLEETGNTFRYAGGLLAYMRGPT